MGGTIGLRLCLSLGLLFSKNLLLQEHGSHLWLSLQVDGTRAQRRRLTQTLSRNDGTDRETVGELIANQRGRRIRLPRCAIDGRLLELMHLVFTLDTENIGERRRKVDLLVDGKLRGVYIDEILLFLQEQVPLHAVSVIKLV